MIVTPGEVEAGAAIWRYFRPWMHMRIAIRGARNRRRARLGKPLLPPLDAAEEVQPMPPHFVTWTGIAVTVVGIVAHAFGVPQCTADVVAAGGACLDPSAIEKAVTALSDAAIALGPVITSIGKVRSMKREKALSAQLEAQASK
jgi:hypothetical protein